MRIPIFIITGVSGSGKTTIGQMLAAHLACPFADADAFHPPENISKMSAGIPLTDADRAGWLLAMNQYIRQQKSGLVLACSALKQTYRDQLGKGVAEDCLHWIHLYGEMDLVRRRMAERKGHFMPESLLVSQFDTWEKPDSGLLIHVSQTPEEILRQIISTMALPTQWGVAGLGVMGLNLARNFARRGFALSLYNRHLAGTEEKVAEKAVVQYPELKEAQAFESLPAFVASLARPRKILLMVNAGAAVDQVFEALIPHLEPGDIVMDGGNSHYEDTQRRQAEATKHGLFFLGVGVSGGESGALNGPAIMCGGDAQAYAQVAAGLETIAAKDAGGQACAALIGPGGAGHFVKMAHNGIEYAEMQLLAEVYGALRWDLGYTPDEVADTLAHWADEGLQSYLLDITIAILRHREGSDWLLDKISDKAAHKGTGSWASIAASELGAPLTMMTEALFARFVAALRNDRQTLSAIYQAPTNRVLLDKQDLKQAYQLARWINHHQGFQFIQLASERHDWQVNPSELARIWTNGCIIRSELMQQAREYLSENSDLLLHPVLRDTVTAFWPSLQRTVSALSYSSRAYPCLMSALAALNGSTTAHSSAHLIQAQRDYFGAHLYERVDDPSGKKYHTQWI
ncbi:MAG TPA: NADP-dependent phosphogluconate dehydrogenase [Saprospiraceae bacterium]|nr:NADP-dependent phosphogluconate dehydrogenase [Saprospiraceae bacterium]